MDEYIETNVNDDNKNYCIPINIDLNSKCNDLECYVDLFIQRYNETSSFSDCRVDNSLLNHYSLKDDSKTFFEDEIKNLLIKAKAEDLFKSSLLDSLSYLNKELTEYVVNPYSMYLNQLHFQNSKLNDINSNLTKIEFIFKNKFLNFGHCGKIVYIIIKYIFIYYFVLSF